MPMNALLKTSEQASSSAPASRIVRLIWLATGLGLVAAGLVLWSVRGERVFADIVSASLAWCM
jgi:hypothetical protein